MKHRIIIVLAVVLLCTAVASAQDKITTSGTCKTDVQHSIAVPDRPNHVFSVTQAKCTPSKSYEIAGVANTGGVGTASNEASAAASHASEVFVDTFANGDKAYYRVETTCALKDGAPQSCENKWRMTSATGKLRGAKGRGTCKITPNADGSIAYDCEGEITSPAPRPAKKG